MPSVSLSPGLGLKSFMSSVSFFFFFSLVDITNLLSNMIVFCTILTKKIVIKENLMLFKILILVWSISLCHDCGK